MGKSKELAEFGSYAQINTATDNVQITGDLTVSGTTITVDSTTITVQNSLTFEGITADDFETVLTVTNPTADRTITLPDATGTVALTSQTLDNLSSITTLDADHVFQIDGSSNSNDVVTFRPEVAGQNNAVIELRSFGNGGSQQGIPELKFWRDTNDGNSAAGDTTARIVFEGGDISGQGYRAPYNYISSVIDDVDLINSQRYGHLEIQHRVTNIGGGSIPDGTYTSAEFHYDRIKAPGKLEIGDTNSATFDPSSLTADQTITFPNVSGTLVVADSNDTVNLTGDNPIIELESTYEWTAGTVAESKLQITNKQNANSDAWQIRVDPDNVETSSSLRINIDNNDVVTFYSDETQGATFFKDIRMWGNSIYFLNGSSNLIFEGATYDDFETTVTVADPTADRTITLPDATGTVLLQNTDNTVTIDVGTAQNTTKLFLTGSDALVQLGDLGSNNGPHGFHFGYDVASSDGMSILYRTASDAITFEDSSGLSGNRVMSVQQDGNVLFTGDLIFEGATADDFETTLTVTDPTADRTITLPDATGTVATIDNSQTFSAQQTFSDDIIMNGNTNRIYFDDISHGIYMEGFNFTGAPAQEYWRVFVGGTQALSAHNINSGSNYVRIGTGFDLQFEGTTSDGNETTLTVIDPTASRTITLPDATGTVALLESTQDFTASQTFSSDLVVGSVLKVEGSIWEEYIVGTVTTNTLTVDILGSANTTQTVSGLSANFEVAFTNAPTSGTYTIGVALIITQGASAYIPNTCTVNGTSVTIKWLNASAPTGNANQTDLVNFTLVNNSGTYDVLAGLSTFG